MKYKVGEKVRYDGGDWWFYGTVSAVFEHSICPCYRLNVERMEKKNCKFSITQFEFELESDIEIENGEDKRIWENSEVEDLKKYYSLLNIEDLSKVLKRSPQAIEEKWQKMTPEKKQETEPKPEKKTKQKPELKQETEQIKVELQQIQEKKPRMRKTTDAWDNNLELYCQGKKSNVLNAWKSKNRKDFQTGILAKDKYDKLMEINFPFDVDKRYKPTTKKTKSEKDETPQKPQKEPLRDIVIAKKSNSWDRQLEEWKKGDRKSTKIQLWKQRSIRRYTQGKLSSDRIAKLKEVGILK
jgi:hypothetical protein